MPVDHIQISPNKTNHRLSFSYLRLQIVNHVTDLPTFPLRVTQDSTACPSSPSWARRAPKAAPSRTASSPTPRPGKVRALTRHPNGDAAAGLRAQGADVVRADVNDPTTLGPALAGAEALFVVTAYWPSIATLGRDDAGDEEVAQFRAVAEAAAQLRWSEAYPDWHRFAPDRTLSLAELGVEGKLVGFEEAVEAVKGQMF